MNRRGLISGGAALAAFAAVEAQAQQGRRAGFPPSYRAGVQGGASAVVAAALTTWNAADKDANMGLVNSRKFSHGATAAWSCIRSLSSYSTGKLYAEAQLNALGADGAAGFGVATPSASLASPPGSDSGAAYLAGGTIRAGGGSVGSATAYAVGSIVQIALDCATGSVWFGKNGTFTGSPTAGTGAATQIPVGTYYLIGGGYDSGDAMTLPATLNYTPPTGFSVWS